MELLDTKEYEEGLHKMDNKRFWAYIALFILTFSFLRHDIGIYF